MTLLKVKNVFKQYGAHLVLEAADLEINEGEIVEIGEPGKVLGEYRENVISGA